MSQDNIYTRKVSWQTRKCQYIAYKVHLLYFPTTILTLIVASSCWNSSPKNGFLLWLPLYVCTITNTRIPGQASPAIPLPFVMIIPATTCPCVGNVYVHDMLACLCLPSWRCIPWSLSNCINIWIPSSNIRLLKFLLPSKEGITREVSLPSMCITMCNTMLCAITYGRTTSKLMGAIDGKSVWWRHRYCGDNNYIIMPSYMMANTIIGWYILLRTHLLLHTHLINSYLKVRKHCREC